jgi:Matrixin
VREVDGIRQPSEPTLTEAPSPGPRKSWPPPSVASARQKAQSRSLGAAALATLLTVTTATLAQKAVSAYIGHDSPAAAHPGSVEQRWHRERLTLVFDESLKELREDPSELVARSLDTWKDSGADLPSLDFETGRGAKPSLTPDGKNSLLVAPIDFPGHETDLAVTVGFSNPKTGEISEADIIINSRHRFLRLGKEQVDSSFQEPESCAGSADGLACDQSYDLENVLTHEFGHFFGLGENFEDSRATMFSCTSACEVHKRDLSSVDRDAITTLYAPAPEATVGCGAAQFSQGRGALAGESALAVMLGLSALVALRRATDPNVFPRRRRR